MNDERENINNIYNKIIYYKNFDDEFPNRHEFLNRNLRIAVRKKIIRSNEIAFMPTVVNDDFHNYKYCVKMYGITPDGSTATVIVKNILPYFHIKVPDNFRNNIKGFIDHIKNIINGYNSEVEIKNREINEKNYEIDERNDSISIYNENIRQYNLKHGTNKPYRDETDRLQLKQGIKLHSITTTAGKYFKGFSLDNDNFITLYFVNVGDRRRAIGILHARVEQELNEGKFITAHDDESCYYRVVCRDYKLNYCNWLNLKQFELDEIQYKSDYTFIIDVENISKFDNIDNKPAYTYDKTMLMCWDGEMYVNNLDPKYNGEVPNKYRDDNPVFCWGLSFSWVDSDKPLLNVCVISKPVTEMTLEMKKKLNADLDHVLFVVCENERDLNIAFSKIVEKMKPQIILGFNDGSFDWPYYITKVDRHGSLLDVKRNMSWKIYNGNSKNYDLNLNRMIRKKYENGKYVKTFSDVKYEQVKIDAETKDNVQFLVFDGYLCIDVRVCFRQIYPNEPKSNLNFYLSKNNLDNKVDMPYTRMFEIYRTGTPEEMAEVAVYCVVDAISCQRLMLKRNVIRDRREVGSLSWTSLYDCFFRANGMKVRNLIIGFGSDPEWNLFFSNISVPAQYKGKYPGAYVVDPIKGLKKGLKDNPFDEEPGEDAPYSGLDFSSLYPSIIMAYNLSPEKMVFSDEYEDQLKNLGYNIHKIEFNMEMTKIDSNGDEFTENKNIISRAVRHNNVEKNKGIYAVILEFLYKERSKLKVHLGEYFDKLEKLNKEIFDLTKIIENKVKNVPDIEEDNILKNKLTKLKTEKREVQFHYNCYNSKQLALKVFMNTFYGETGNKISPLYVLETAGGITCSGVYNIKFVENIVMKEKNFIRAYGDTDSLYLSPPPDSFNDLKQYYVDRNLDKLCEGLDDNFREINSELDNDKLCKLALCTQKVKRTFTIMQEIKDYINKRLEQDNGTQHLKMAYEEVLYPVAFLGKKKYYGIPHEKEINFNPTNFFIRGLEMKKKGKSVILRKLSTDIMRDSMDIFNNDELKDIVTKKFIEYYENKNIDINDFAITGIYKPNKKNIQMHTFYNRMVKTKGVELAPNPGERFTYVIVKKYPFKYDVKGRKTKISVGDKIEYIEDAIKFNMPIDVDHYVKGGIMATLARFITYAKEFKVLDPNIDDTEKDKIEMDNASKYLENISNKYKSDFIDKGNVYKKVYKTVSNTVTEGISCIIDDKLEHIDGSANFNIFRDKKINKTEYGDIYQKLINICDQQAKRRATGYGILYENTYKEYCNINNIKYDVFKLYKLKCKYDKDRKYYLDTIVKQEIISELNKLCEKFKNVLKKYNDIIESNVMKVKQLLDKNNNNHQLELLDNININSILNSISYNDILTDYDKEIIVQLQYKINHMIYVYQQIYEIDNIKLHLIDRQQQKSGINELPLTVNKKDLTDKLLNTIVNNKNKKNTFEQSIMNMML